MLIQIAECKKDQRTFKRDAHQVDSFLIDCHIQIPYSFSKDMHIEWILSKQICHIYIFIPCYSNQNIGCSLDRGKRLPESVL